MRVRSFGVALLGASMLSFSAAAVRADTLKPLDYRAYDGWNAIQHTVLTDDGRRVAYALVPEDGEPTLVTRELASGAETRDARGTDEAFAADGSWMAFTLAPKHAALEDARRKGKPPAAEVPRGFAVRTFGAHGDVFAREDVKSWKHAKHGSRFVAYWADAPKDAGASPSPSPAPSGSPDPNATFKKKDDAKTLTLRDVPAGTQTTLADVVDYAFSPDEAYLAYAVETKDGATDGLYVRTLATGATATIARGSGRYKHVTFAPERSQLAFLSDGETYAAPAPRYAIYEWEPGAATAKRLDDPSAAEAPSENREPRFTRDGERIFYGVAAPATPQPSNTPFPIAMDIWNYHDQKLQSEQRVEADATRKDSDVVVTWLGATPHTVALADRRLGAVQTVDNPAFALLANDRAFRMSASWDGGKHEYDAIDLHTGAVRRLVGATRFDATIANDGGEVLAFDDGAQRWYGVRTADAKRTTCSPAHAVAFGDELDDHPDVRPPYGAAGFTADGMHAVVYDRYDAWSCDLATGAMRRLTDGRASHVAYRYIALDPEEHALPPTLTFATFDERTKRAGLATLAPGAARPHDTPLVAGFYGTAVKAKNAATVVVPRGSMETFPDLYATDTTFSSFAKFTNANPQQAEYRWGTSRLVHWTSTQGKKLDGVLLVPNGLDPHAKAPMLVYFYERYSDELNHYFVPGPGTSPSLIRYVSNGYLVFMPDVAYTPGHPGASALAAILPGVKAAEKAAGGLVDDGRVGIAGHSWAAYQIAYMLTKTHRFRAAEAGAAVTNMTSAYGGIRWGSGVVRESQYEVGQSRIGAAPWERPDLYLENSALFHIASITTPYLTIANDADDAVPWYQGIEFFTAMRRLHKEAYMFVYGAEFHNLRNRENQKHWTVHLDEYFDYYLKGAPEPDWMKSGVDFADRGKRDVRPLYGEESP
jgi:dipeptidyl aminopeptidase/acylaminoacyl peptidase